MRFLFLLLAACGARTGLDVPEASVTFDAGMDAGRDGGRDAGMIDAGCEPGVLSFTRDPAEIVFVLDRSGSMSLTWDGRPPAGLPTRWQIVDETLSGVLPSFDAAVAFGANVFPSGREAESCEVDAILDVAPQLGGAAAVLRVFDEDSPIGGTPTAQGVRTTRDALERRPSDRPRFLVLTTDGGPNCNPDTGVPQDECVCTSVQSACLDPDRGAESCLDDVRTVETIRETAEEHGMPVLVIGIDAPTRPELLDALDRMAIAGGWPRPEGSEHRFYDARQPDDLRAAFAEIVDRIAECVFVADRAAPGGEVEIALDGDVLPQDPIDGWEWTDPDAGILALFGASCDRLRMSGGTLSGRIISCAR